MGLNSVKLMKSDASNGKTLNAMRRPRTGKMQMLRTVRSENPRTTLRDDALAPSPGTPGEGWDEGFCSDSTTVMANRRALTLPFHLAISANDRSTGRGENEASISRRRSSY